MKLIIDIESRYYKNMRSEVKELYYEAINRIIEAVSNGIPYEERPQGKPLYTITSNTFVEGASMRPHHEWRVNKYGDHICPICGNSALYVEEQDNQYYEVQSNFCPECGADLRGDNNDNKV